MNLVDAIRSIVQHNIQDRDSLIDLAAEYAEECAELNGRMRQVVELLHAGQISEATDLADAQPPVLERFAELDFPELNDWFSLLLSFQLDPPPPLLQDLAAEIDQAYADKDSLSDLLRLQRLLVLRRAPLKNRMETLRNLVAMQPDNPLWRADLLELEQARLKEINIEAKKASSEKNAAAVNSLLYELNTEWSISIPSQLIDSVYEVKTQLDAEKAREQLTALNQQLNRCLSEFNVEEASRLRDQWHALVEPARLTPNDPLQQEVAEVFLWLEDEEKEAQFEAAYQAQLRKLEDGISQKLPFDQIDKLYYGALQFDREIPEVLESRYRMAQDNHRIQAKRKFIFNVSVTVLAVLLAGASIFYVIRSVQYSGRKSEAIASLQKAVNDEEWERGVEIFIKLDQSLANEPVIMELGTKVKQAFEKENTRLADFAALLKQIEEIAKDPPPDDLISRAYDVAKGESENRKVEAFETEIQACQQQLLTERNSEFVLQFDEISSQLVEAEKKAHETLDADPIDEILYQVQKLKTKYKGTRYGYPVATKSLVDKLDPLQIRCENVIASTKQKKREATELAKIEAAVGNPGQFAAALKNYKSAFPGSRFQADFSIVGDELSYAVDWNLVSNLSRHPTLSDKSLNGSKATSFLDLVSKSEQDRPGFPFYSEFEKIKPKLEELASLDHQSILKSLDPMLKWYPFTSLWVMKDDLDRKIYVPLEPKVDNGKANTFYFETIPNRASDNSKKRTFTNIKSTMKAPHVKLVEMISQKLGESKDVGFETAILNAIDVCLSAIPGDEQPEIIVRAFVLRGLMKSCAKGNKLIGTELQPWIKRLDQVGLDRNDKGEAGDWVGVSNSNANLMRGVLRKYFIDIKSQLKLADLRKLIDRARELPTIRPMPPIEWTGFLLRSPNGRWEVRSQNPIPPGTELYCLLRTGSTYNLTSIGQYPDKLSLSTGRNGRPVYIIKQK